MEVLFLNEIFRNTWGTLPKTNSSPLKNRGFPKGKDRIPTIHFQVRAVGLREGDSSQKETMAVQPEKVFWDVGNHNDPQFPNVSW